MIGVVFRHQLRSFGSQRITQVVLATLLGMTTLAAVIGWSSRNTIGAVYDQAVVLATTAGQIVPANPFDLKPPLAMLSNLSIYTTMIGALLALVVGHLSLAPDRADGLGRLIMTRPLNRREYLIGKITSVAVVLAIAVAASMVLSAIAVPLVNQSLPSAGELGRLLLFFGLAWLYLMLFAMIGMATVLMTRTRSGSLLSAMGVWLVLTFALPQFTSATNPVASLNPITNPVSTSQPFFALTARARPISVTEQFKFAEAHLLGTAPSEPPGTTAARAVPLLAGVAIAGFIADRRITRHDYSEGPSDD